MHDLVLNEEIYQRVLLERVPTASRYLWIATADIKDLHVDAGRKKFTPFVAVLAGLVSNGVAVRLIHAKEPGPRFRKDFDKHPDLLTSDLFERVLCPRMHTKAIIVDGTFAYIGSANLTGAGMGAKSPNRRNFEAGFVTDDRATITRLMDQLDSLYLGDFCPGCGRRDICPDPIV